MDRHKSLTVISLVLSIFIGLMFLSGCSERETSAPPSGPGGPFLAGSQMTHEGMWIGVQGGLLRLRWHELYIPENALAEPTLIRISLPYPDSLFLDLEPSGLWFNHDVELRFSYREVDLGLVEEDSLAVYRLVDSTGVWECLGGQVDRWQDQVVVWLEHFSRYALASR